MTTFLQNLVLGVNNPRSKEDESAVRSLRRLIRKRKPNAELKIASNAVEGMKSPYLFAAHGMCFRGLEGIRAFCRLERSLGT